MVDVGRGAVTAVATSLGTIATAGEFAGTSTPQVAVTTIAHVVGTVCGNNCDIFTTKRALWARALFVKNSTIVTMVVCSAVRRRSSARRTLDLTVDHRRFCSSAMSPMDFPSM
jgi:hypothetical protein